MVKAHQLKQHYTYTPSMGVDKWDSCELRTPEGVVQIYLSNVDQTHKVDRLLIERSEQFTNRAIANAAYTRELYTVFSVFKNIIGPIELFRSQTKARRAFEYRCELPHRVSNVRDCFAVYPVLTEDLASESSINTFVRQLWSDNFQSEVLRE